MAGKTGAFGQVNHIAAMVHTSARPWRGIPLDRQDFAPLPNRSGAFSFQESAVKKPRGAGSRTVMINARERLDFEPMAIHWGNVQPPPPPAPKAKGSKRGGKR